MLAPGTELISQSVVGNRQLHSGLGALVLVFTIVACGPGGASVTILNGEIPHPSGSTACYTSFTTGDLVTDPISGTAIIEPSGRRYAVIWPVGWTGRSSGAEVEVLNQSGAVVVRTGTQVYLPGGYADEFSADRGFLTCAGAKPLP